MAQTATDLAAALLPVLPFMQGAELMPEIGRVINSAKVSDHHAIIPTTAFAGNGFDGLPESEKKLMSLVCCKLLCAVAAPQEYETVTAVFDCGGKQFTAKGKTILMAGWKDIDARFRAALKAKPDEDGAEDAALPELSEGQIFEAATASVSAQALHRGFASVRNGERGQGRYAGGCRAARAGNSGNAGSDD